MVARTGTGRHDAPTAAAREVYKLIHAMTPAELASLRARTSALLAGAETHDDETRGGREAPVDWLLAGIEGELRRRGVVGHRARLLPSRVYPSYEALSRPARETLAAALGRRARPAELAALGRLAAECLAEYVEAMRVPISPRTMLQHAGEAAAAVDASFPGYAARGMLGMCLGE